MFSKFSFAKLSGSFSALFKPSFDSDKLGSPGALEGKDVAYLLKHAFKFKNVKLLEEEHPERGTMVFAVKDTRRDQEGPKRKAVKVYKYDYEEMDREWAVLNHISHDNIVAFFGLIALDKPESGKKKHLRAAVRVVENNNELHDSRPNVIGGILLEKMQMNLSQWMENYVTGLIGDDMLESIFLQMGSALAYLHQHHITHGDFKAENVGVVQHLGRKRLPQLKLIDFGRAKFHTAEKYEEAQQRSTWYTINVDQVEPENARPTMKVGYWSVNHYPLNVWARNPFLIEAFTFASYLIRLSLMRTNRQLTNQRLIKTLSVMAPISGQEQVTVSWALEEYKNVNVQQLSNSTPIKHA